MLKRHGVRVGALQHRQHRGRGAREDERGRGSAGALAPGLSAGACTGASLSGVGPELLPPTGARECSVQPRYRSQAEPARVERYENRLKVHFARPQRALTPGQVCAVYEGGQLLGGGIFETIAPDDGRPG